MFLDVYSQEVRMAIQEKPDEGVMGWPEVSPGAGVADACSVQGRW